MVKPELRDDALFRSTGSGEADDQFDNPHEGIMKIAVKASKNGRRRRKASLSIAE